MFEPHSLILAVFPFFELQQWMEAPDQDEGSNKEAVSALAALGQYCLLTNV